MLYLTVVWPRFIQTNWYCLISDMTISPMCYIYRTLTSTRSTCLTVAHTLVPLSSCPFIHCICVDMHIINAAASICVCTVFIISLSYWTHCVLLLYCVYLMYSQKAPTPNSESWYFMCSARTTQTLKTLSTQKWTLIDIQGTTAPTAANLSASTLGRTRRRGGNGL